MPDNKATSCLANVRGEEESCILGIVQKHWAWRDAAAENPCKRRRPIKGDDSVEWFGWFGLLFVHMYVSKTTQPVVTVEQLEAAENEGFSVQSLP